MNTQTQATSTQTFRAFLLAVAVGMVIRGVIIGGIMGVML
jgi:hypothetical protein